MLARLAIHYYRPDFTEGQAKLLIQDYLEDLHGFTVEEIRAAIQDYRQDGKAKYFPPIGRLIDLCQAVRKAAYEAAADAQRKPATPQFGDSRPIMWWAMNRKLWQPHWREHDVPEGEFVRDAETGKLRKPYRFASMRSTPTQGEEGKWR